jgi:hypothetical protein
LAETKEVEMSRGPGRWQQAILRALRRPGLFPLHGATASETAALLRAARKLEAAGQCVIVRKRGEGRRPAFYAGPPGMAIPGAEAGGEPVNGNRI